MKAIQTFITNADNRKLKSRLVELIGYSRELKFLIGFFYFSGISELYESLKNEPDPQLKILVGLNVDKQLHGLVEYGDSAAETTANERFDRYLAAVGKSINSEDFDNQEFYEQVRFFLDLIARDKLIIRKTRKPNHAKLYIFRLKEGHIKESLFITGSSNLTRAGLAGQDEFNVEISDYGAKEAEAFFDDLWMQADKITEHEQFKSRLIDLIENKTLVAEVTPFEAFVLVLKTYLETQDQKHLKQDIKDLLTDRGYKPYAYQLDAVRQALTIIDSYGGVIISDVVGLGKSVIAGMIARSLGKRGIVICRPSLRGDENAKSGWTKYIEDFKLYDWAVRSWGKLESVLDLVADNNEYEVVIIDEAHNFRNQDTEDYDLLRNICRNKLVILLTATPFNNSPSDIFALLKLFIVPGKSKITLDNNLDAKFRMFAGEFTKLSYIKRHHNSADPKKRAKALSWYRSIFDSDVIEISKVTTRAQLLARHIRGVIEPVTIRRNRIDLRKDPEYSKEVYELSQVADPKELFFELTPEQSAFYEQVINEFFCEGGRFRGAIYQPYNYDVGGEDGADEGDGREVNREKLTQKNLYDFMRRLLVKRFESSFGAFERSIENFISITSVVQAFIEKTGQYILDRKLIEKIYEDEPDMIEAELVEFARKLEEGDFPKTNKIYKLKEFAEPKEFLDDIASDLRLFHEVLDSLKKLNLVADDPKAKSLIGELDQIIKSTTNSDEPPRKVIIFTEYADTAKYLEPLLAGAFSGRVITSKGDLTPAKVQVILENFDAVYGGKPKDDAQILLTTDQLSEGFNLNRAGAIINYDIPWNPTRVIQRVGRINRISKKIFEELHVFNFFPTSQGADIIQSREIAAHKMFLIHNTLGEDSKIFEADETPSPAKLFNKITRNPEEGEDESPQTLIRQKYFEIVAGNPEIIGRVAQLAPRVKTAKAFSTDQLMVFIKKGLGFFIRADLSGGKIAQPDLLEVFDLIECEPSEKGLPLGAAFWDRYEKIKTHKEHSTIPANEQSIEKKALNNLKHLLKHDEQLEPFRSLIRMLLEDVIEYKTLSEYALRKIAGLNIDSPADLARTTEGLRKIQRDLGPDYLDKTKRSLGELSSEVIIAVENRSLT